MKRKTLIWILITVTMTVFCQDISDLKSNPSVNIIQQFSEVDLSSLFKNKDGSYDGVIGSRYKRIHIYFDTIVKSQDDELTYIASGRTKVGDNVCDFRGVLVFYYANKDASFKEDERTDIEGTLKANYILREDSEQKNTGFFKGELTSYWTTKDDAIVLGTGWYTAIDQDFVFEGSWQGYKSDKISKCCWSNYRIPCVPEDFDMSDGPDIIPNKKYKDVGWDNLNIIFTSNPDSDEYKNALKAEEAESNWWKK